MVSTVEATGEPPLASPEPSPATATPRWAWILAAVLSAVPVLRMGVLVAGAHPLPYNDYWPMIYSVLTDSGGFDPSGLFDLRNEHPLVVAKLLYWLNLQVTGGSNIALGFVVMGIALGQLAVVAVLGRDLAARWRFAPPALVVTAACLLFARQGSWHFLKSMSGAAWLSANLFALLAIWAQVRGRHLLALAGAVLATLSYGTGLAVWPVLIVVGLLSGARVRQLVPTFVAGVVAVVWLQVQLADLGKTAADRPPLVSWMARSAEVVGAFLLPNHRVTDIRLGEALIALGVIAAIVVVVRALRGTEDATVAAPWVGLVALGTGMAMLVAAGRNTILWTGSVGRYSACGAIACLGLAGLGLALLPRRGIAGRAGPVAAVVVLGALSVWVLRGGDREVARLEGLRSNQDLVAIALEAHLLDGSRLPLGNFELLDAPGIEDRLDAAGQRSFVGDDTDCGRLATTLAADERQSDLPAGVSGAVTRLEEAGQSIPGGVVFDGWVEGAGLSCAVLVEPDGTVVGASGHGSVHEGYGGPGAVDVPGRTWFSGLAPLTAEATVYVALDGHDGFYAPPPAG
jgi:hypothetical protein